MLDESASKFYEEFCKENNLLGEYCAFSCYIQDTFIVIVDRFEWVRKHHPILWRIATWILSL